MLSSTEFPTLPGVAEAPTSATDCGVKKVSMNSMFGWAFEIASFLISFLRIIFASTTKYDFGYTTIGLKSTLSKYVQINWLASPVSLKNLSTLEFCKHRFCIIDSNWKHPECNIFEYLCKHASKPYHNDRTKLWVVLQSYNKLYSLWYHLFKQNSF